MMERVFKSFPTLLLQNEAARNLFQRDKNYVCQFSSSYPKLYSRQSFPQVFQFLLWDPERDPWDIHDIGVRYGLLRAWHSMPRKPGLVSRRHLD